MLQKRSTQQCTDIRDRARRHNKGRDSARTLGIITERGGNESHYVRTVSTRPATVELLRERKKETFRKTREANVIQLLARRNSYGMGNVLEPAGCRRHATSRRCDDLDDLARQAPALLLAPFVLSTRRDRVPVPVATAGTSDAARDCWLEDPGQPSHIVDPRRSFLTTAPAVQLSGTRPFKCTTPKSLRAHHDRSAGAVETVVSVSVPWHRYPQTDADCRFRGRVFSTKRRVLPHQPSVPVCREGVGTCL